MQPDYTSMYRADFTEASRKAAFGEAEYYYVSSIYGSFRVHESRCLVFRNGTLPEQISNSLYQGWGIPEYIRIKRALRETTTAHTDAVKLLERSVQAIYSMKNLAQLLATDDGENQVLKRLETIDMSRGLLNSIAIDAEGEAYDFKTFQFSGVSNVIDSTCNMLSALTSIPQTILFGRSPAGMNATGTSDLENYYNFIERIQKMMLKNNLRYLLDVIYKAAEAKGTLTEKPKYKLTFNPLWSLSETEQAAVEQTKAATAMTKAQTAQVYVDMQAIDPSEIRAKLAGDEDFTVEDIVDEDSDLYEEVTQKLQQQQEMPEDEEQGQEEQEPSSEEQGDDGKNSKKVLPTADDEGIITNRADEFNENDHPRGEGGKFTDGGGGSSNSGSSGKGKSKEKEPKDKQSEESAKEGKAEESSEEESQSGESTENKKPSAESSGSENTGSEKEPIVRKPPKPTKFVRNGNTVEVTKPISIKIANSSGRIKMLNRTITGVEDFAGQGCKKPLEKEPELLKQYPNSKPGSWRHTLGYGTVKNSKGKEYDAEIHWFESDDVGQVGWKVKHFGKGKK